MHVTADQILTVMDDARWMVQHLARNSAALQWDKAQEAVLRGLDCPVPDGFAIGMPLLKYADGSDAVRLIDAMMNPPRPTKGGVFRCDIEGGEHSGQANVLLVPCGASLVQLRVCDAVREHLDHLCANALFWW